MNILSKEVTKALYRGIGSFYFDFLLFPKKNNMVAGSKGTPSLFL